MIKKQENHRGSKAGFSLIELLITVSIIAVLTTAATVGFRYMGDTLRTKQAGGVIADTIKLLELELLQDYYTKSRIYFLSDYLVAVSDSETDSLNITWNGFDTTDCPDMGEIGIGLGSNGNLAKSNEEGVTLAITSVSENSSECVDFGSSEDREWHYQIVSGSEKSALIRFIHFNINRDEPSQITLTPSTYSLEISAPYSTKQIYDSAGPVTGSIDLEVLNAEVETKEMITIN